MFSLDPYHVLLASAGIGIILSYWVPRYFSGREPAASALLILAGFLAFNWIPGMPQAIDPTRSPRIWEVTAELCVIIGLFGTGLRIDRVFNYNQWRATIRLLALAMPLTIGALAVVGWQFAGMTLAGALLLGAILAPTDPVLAGDVQVGPPLEGGEHPVRFALTTEAGLNDGLAFPFVHLGVAFATAGVLTWGMAGQWLWLDVGYRITVGVLAGAAAGWILGKLLFGWPRGNALSRTQSGVVAFAGVLFAYGLTELVEGYGFIAVFVAAIVLRREESHDRFHEKMHTFSESLEHTLTALLLVGLGAAMPALYPYLDMQHALIALALVFIIRPGAAMISLIGVPLAMRERLVVAFYGVRGIGSVYYLGYAGHHVELVDEGALWATIAFTILLSTLVHGLTAGIAVEQATGEAIGKVDKDGNDANPATADVEGAEPVRT